jgi:hypothetical protein
MRRGRKKERNCGKTKQGAQYFAWKLPHVLVLASFEIFIELW